MKSESLARGQDRVNEGDALVHAGVSLECGVQEATTRGDSTGRSDVCECVARAYRRDMAIALSPGMTLEEV
jgi:hypothetical protein